MLIFLLGCHPAEKPGTGDDTASGHDDPTLDSVPPDDTAAAVEEACNGVDDDGDGAVDEDFPDSDADGRAD